jgi:hypothetical protein
MNDGKSLYDPETALLSHRTKPEQALFKIEGVCAL